MPASYIMMDEYNVTFTVKSKTNMNRDPEIFANSLLDAPDLSSVLYILYWNLPLNATALRDLGDLRLVVQKEEARRVKQYENTLSPNCSRHCEIKKLCVCGEVFTQRHYDYMAKEKGK
jgi:hypothetical protein